MIAARQRKVATPVSDAQLPRPASRLNPAYLALIAVCVLHALSPLILRGVHAGLGWDETVYVSQIDPHVPAGVFSAPRARGMTLLTAPASLVSSSLAVMRIWLAFLSAVGLFVAFLPWLRLRKGAIVPIAAALWSSVWVSIYYGFEAMPNQYVAYGALAATGWLVLALREPARKRYLGYVAIALTFTALMRPSDSVFLTGALALAVIVVRGLTVRRRLAMLTVMASGLALGFAEWVIEAYARFGGPVARFHAASAENTGGFHWSLGAQLRTLAGPLLCRTGCTASAPTTARLWWFALVPLVILGLVVARRLKVATMHVIAVVVALALAAEYVVAIGYSAPRFLEPAYLLVALPIAEGMVWVGHRIAPVWRPIAIAAMAAVVVAQLNVQTHIITVQERVVAIDTARDEAIADSLNATGIRGHCSISGIDAATIAFMARCNDTPRPPTAPVTSDGHPVAVAVIQHRLPDTATYWSSWPEYTIQGANIEGKWRVWVLPRRTPASFTITDPA